MSLSFNEIEAIALKAARGAGVSWGLAEEAAFAARWLAERGFDWAEALLARCKADVSDAVSIEAGCIEGQTLCPLRVGAFLADAGMPGDGVEIRDVAVPLLLLPFVARASQQAVVVRTGSELVAWIEQGQIHTDRRQINPLVSAPVRIRSGPCPAGFELMPLLARPLPIGVEMAEGLAAFERRTYVPATVQSRLAGAGAGLSDND